MCQCKGSNNFKKLPKTCCWKYQRTKEQKMIVTGKYVADTMNNIIHPFERVMLVDDNDIDLLIMSRIISRNDFAAEVTKYSMPAKALQFLKLNQNQPKLLPQLIFLDIHMPVMSGFDFMEVYSGLPAVVHNNCKVYIISSTCNESDILRVQNEENVVGFHEKPMTKEFLENIILSLNPVDSQ